MADYETSNRSDTCVLNGIGVRDRRTIDDVLAYSADNAMRKGDRTHATSTIVTRCPRSREGGIVVVFIVIEATPGDAMKRVFISYRHDDTGPWVTWLSQQLKALFPDEIFLDSDIRAATNFVEALNRELISCDAALVIIGHRWLGSDDDGQPPRIHDSGDFVRLEVEQLLNRRIPVIPVLVDGILAGPMRGRKPDRIRRPAEIGYRRTPDSSLVGLSAIEGRRVSFGM